MLKLDEAPPEVSAEAWASGSSSLPSVGDLWLLSWDGEALGLAIVSGVAPSFVLVWPVTLPGEPSFPAAIEIPATPLGQPLNVWPSRETGIGMHLLHRRFGQAISERMMAATASALEGDGEMPLSFASPNVDEPEREAASDAMVDRWESICLHIWPEPRAGVEPFDSNALRALGLQVGDLRAALGLNVPDAVSLFSGEIAPTETQVQELVEQTGMGVSELLITHLDEASRELLSPEIKDDVLAIASLRDVSEEAARALLRSEYALAARSDGSPRARLEAAIHRLLKA